MYDRTSLKHHLSISYKRKNYVQISWVSEMSLLRREDGAAGQARGGRGWAGRCARATTGRDPGTNDVSTNARMVGWGDSVDRHSHARSPTRLLAASLLPSLASPRVPLPTSRTTSLGASRVVVAVGSVRHKIGAQLKFLQKFNF